MAFDFYFAGQHCGDTDNIIKELNANILRSYYYDKKSLLKKWFIDKANGSYKGKIMIDSGAFTLHRKDGTIDIDEYINWLNENDAYYDYAIELDFIPGKWGTIRTKEDFTIGAEESWKNYLYMYDRLKSPQKLLPVFHQGEEFKYLENILVNSNAEYICISGSKDLTNKDREQWYRKCFEIILKLKPTIKTHCLGSATLSNVEKYPFTSTDATTYIMTAANGGILTDYGTVYVGDGGKELKNIGTEAYNTLIKYLEKYNLTLEEVGSDYKKRTRANVCYLFDKSRTTSFKNNITERKSLF